MYFFAIVSLFPFLIICNCECDHKNDKKLLELKSDVEKIGNGFENLAFDVMEQIMDKVRTYGVVGDYYTSDESESKEINSQLHGDKKIFENSTQVYAKKKPLLIEENPDTRPKRSVDNIIPTNFSESSIENTVESSFNNTPPCPKKTLEEQQLERQHIEDLKEEVKKLYDLVVLLKDQQKIMSLLDQEAKNLDSDISKRFDTKDLLTILDRVNNEDTLSIDGGTTDTKRKITENDVGKKNTHEELEQIKLDLRSAISALNRTKEILAMERKKEIDLENELRDHRIELNFLKVMIQRLYENNTVFHTENKVATDQIVGASIHLPKELPTKDKTPNTKERSNKLNRTDTVSRSPMNLNENKARSSDVDDLENLFHELRKPKKDDLESRMFELKKEMETKKQEVDLLKQLDMLQKFISDRKESHTSNSLSDDESIMVKRLLSALKKEQPQSKVIDDDVEMELQKLQNAIDNLKPKDEWDVKPDKKEGAYLQKLLSKLLSQEGKKDDVSIGPELSPKQIADLKRRLDDVAEGNMYPNRYGYGYGPQFAETLSGKYTCKLEASQQSNSEIHASDLFGRGPPSQYFGNLPNPYSQLPTNGILNNRGMYTPSGNIPYNSYLPSTVNSFQSQNFGATSNTRPIEITTTSSGYNRNILAPTIQANSFGGNMGQNGPYNFGKIITQSGIKHQKAFVAPASPNQYDYQGLSELHQKLFGANAAQTIVNPYGQDSAQKETKNQFFLAPQSNVYEKPAPSAVFAQANVAGGSQEKPGYYPQQNTGYTDYRYQKIEDISSQVERLQNAINTLNKPDYVQRPEDRETIVNLERQISELKAIMSGLTPDIISNLPNYTATSPVYDQHNRQLQQEQRNYQKIARRSRSTEDNQLNLEDPKLYDQVVSSLKQLIFENDTQKEERSSYYDDVQTKIEDLKLQLEDHLHRSSTGQRHYSPPIYPSNLHKPLYNQYGSELPTMPAKLFKNDLIQPKKNDIFTSIVLKILDKILASVPAVLQRLFGYSLSQFFNYGDSNAYGDYDSDYNVGYGGQNSIQGIFKSLGLFGYLPLVVLKIIDGITIFVNILKKNTFFKNFLLPALVLLLVAGSVLFLIWWLQLSEDISYNQQGIGDISYDNYGQYSNNGYQNNRYNTPNYVNNHNTNYGYRDNNYGSKRSYNNPVYSRSYFDYNR